MNIHPVNQRKSESQTAFWDKQIVFLHIEQLETLPDWSVLTPVNGSKV